MWSGSCSVRQRTGWGWSGGRAALAYSRQVLKNASSRRSVCNRSVSAPEVLFAATRLVASEQKRPSQIEAADRENEANQVQSQEGKNDRKENVHRYRSKI